MIATRDIASIEPKAGRGGSVTYVTPTPKPGRTAGRTAGRIVLTPRQSAAWDALHEDGVREVLYGGAKGGGKSVLGCVWLYSYCCELIDSLQLAPRRHPVPVAWMCRARAVDFSNSTLETFKSTIPYGEYELRQGDRELVIRGAVKIDFGGLDDESALAKFNSAEYCALFLDQAEETTRDTVAHLRASLRRKIDGQSVPRRVLWTANPRDCWLRDEFVRGAPSPKLRYVPALPRDNPHLEPDYIERVQSAFAHRPELLAAYIDGSWDAFASVSQMIRDSWVAAAHTRRLFGEPVRLLTCDPARYGDDETAIYGIEGTEIKLATIYGQRDTMHTANTLYTLSREWGMCPVAVDVCGVGGGVADRLVEMGVRVIALNAAAASSDQTRYVNLRAEMWDLASRMFSDGDVSLAHQDEELDRQLCAPTYEYRSGKLLVEAKDKIKDRLSRSPDRADAYVQGLYALCLLRRQLRAVPTDSVRVLAGKAAPAAAVAPGSFADRRRQYEREHQQRSEPTW